MKAEHTPTPWYAVQHLGGKRSIQSKKEGAGLLIANAVTEADAELIVKAVNCHFDFINGVEHLLIQLKARKFTCEGGHSLNDLHAIAKLEQALTKSKE